MFVNTNTITLLFLIPFVSIKASADLIKMAKDYVCQYCAAKSLPFTAAEMAMDVVSATFKTILPKGVDGQLIKALRKVGYQQEANMMSTMQYVSAHVDTGGVLSTKRKAESPEKTPRPKRSCFRIHRTTVAKRVNIMKASVLQQKLKFLEDCLYVGLIVDEGNNYKRSCPLYAGVICCDALFNWRIMFIGQADCEGKKDGESIFKLVKKNFYDQVAYTSPSHLNSLS